MYHEPTNRDQLGRLVDSLLEHCPDDPDFGPPEGWPSKYDEDVAALGSPLHEEETFQPDEADWQAYLDLCERIETEQRFGINMRFR